uniref:Uncharacterized protein n=1 Tax=Mizugakiibacter sediminis TaxID=1475481 RepID=A0A0S6YZR0_9GAMM
MLDPHLGVALVARGQRFQQRPQPVLRVEAAHARQQAERLAREDQRTPAGGGIERRLRAGVVQHELGEAAVGRRAGEAGHARGRGGGFQLLRALAFEAGAAVQQAPGQRFDRRHQ